MKKALVRITENTPSMKYHDLHFQYRRLAEESVTRAIAQMEKHAFCMSDKNKTVVLPWERIASITVSMVDLVQ